MYFGIINYPKYCLSVSFTQSKSQHQSFWPGFIKTSIILSSQSPEQGQGCPRTGERMLTSLRHCKEGRAEGEEKRTRLQRVRRLGWWKGQGGLFFAFEIKNKAGAAPLLCEASGRIFCIAPLVADAWFYFFSNRFWTDCKVMFQQSLGALDSVLRPMPRTLRVLFLTSVFCESPWVQPCTSTAHIFGRKLSVCTRSSFCIICRMFPLSHRGKISS